MRAAGCIALMPKGALGTKCRTLGELMPERARPTVPKGAGAAIRDALMGCESQPFLGTPGFLSRVPELRSTVGDRAPNGLGFTSVRVLRPVSAGSSESTSGPQSRSRSYVSASYLPLRLVRRLCKARWLRGVVWAHGESVRKIG